MLRGTVVVRWHACRNLNYTICQTESAFVTLPATRTGWIELSSELWLLNVMHPVVLTNIYLFLTTLYSDILWPSLYCGITLCNFLIVIILR